MIDRWDQARVAEIRKLLARIDALTTELGAALEEYEAFRLRVEVLEAALRAVAPEVLAAMEGT